MGWFEDKFYDMMEQPLTKKDPYNRKIPIKNPKPFFGYFNMAIFGLFLIWLFLL